MSKKKRKTPPTELKIFEPPKTPPLTPKINIDYFPEPLIVDKVRHSGHYVDQKLKYNKPDSQPSLFDTLSQETIDKITNKNEVETIVEGIKLSIAEDKLLTALLNLNHKKSNVKINKENLPAEPDKYYRGNMATVIVTFGNREIHTPTLRITPHEFFTEVTGTKDYSGEEIKYYNGILKSLESKNYLIKYKRQRKIKTNGKTNTVIDRVEEYLPLIKIIKYYEGLSKEEDEQLDHNENTPLSNIKGEIIIKFSPLFVDQIDTKFILYPTDINKRTEIASGGSHKVTTAIIKLRDYLMRSLSNKNYSVTLDKENLPYILGLDKYIQESRKKLIDQRVKESIQAVITLGLVTEVKTKTGVKYQPQYEFILNKDF